jgi:hypothetical protein
MARRKPDEDDGNLDSLLDTVMNVVGILIIVLVVTQLGVGDAVKRIGETVAVDPQTLAAAQKKLAELEQLRNRLQASLVNVAPVEDQDYDQQLEELRQQIQRRQQQLDQLLVQQQLEQEQQSRAQQQAAAVAKQMQEDQAAREELQQEITQAQEKEAQLKAMLANTEPRGQLPPVEITLPNPRPAPEGAQQVTIVCKNNELYPINQDGFRAEAQQVGLRVIQTERLQLHLPLGENQKILYLQDPERFVREFNKRPLRDRYVRVELEAAGANPRLVFYPIEGGGEDEQSVTGVRSRFRQQLQSLDGQQYYLRFYVCADSFDIYVTARRVMSELGLLAGWEPQPVDWLYRANLGGPIRLGPPPKPQPPPKTPPGPQPEPPPKPKPANVID